MENAVSQVVVDARYRRYITLLGFTGIVSARSGSRALTGNESSCISASPTNCS